MIRLARTNWSNPDGRTVSSAAKRKSIFLHAAAAAGAEDASLKVPHPFAVSRHHLDELRCTRAGDQDPGGSQLMIRVYEDFNLGICFGIF